jgi:hypothetical protein
MAVVTEHGGDEVLRRREGGGGGRGEEGTGARAATQGGDMVAAAPCLHGTKTKVREMGDAIEHKLPNYPSIKLIQINNSSTFMYLPLLTFQYFLVLLFFPPSD